MKVKHRLLALLLTLTLVLTFMPAMAFAGDGSSDKYPTKIEYKGDTEYIPAGVDGYYEDELNFWEVGNKIIVTWSDNTTQTFIAKEYSYKDRYGDTYSGFDYFAEGEEPDINIDEDGGVSVKNRKDVGLESEGNGKFNITFYYEYEDADENNNPVTVSTEVTGKKITSLTYSGPKIEYDQDDDGERWGGDIYQEGAKIIVNYSDGSKKTAVCKKWGTNKDSDNYTYDEYSYFFEGVTPAVYKDGDGNNAVSNAVWFDYDWDESTATSLPVTYRGVTSRFPISKKIYPKPKKAEFVPAKGFTATAKIGQDYFYEDELYSKGNKFVVTWDNGKVEEYVYGTYKDRAGYKETCFGYVTEEGWIQNLWSDFTVKRFKKGSNTITGKVNIWAEGYDDSFKLPFKVNVKGSGYYAYAEYNQYTYTGKAITPKVTVYVANNKGKMIKLKASKYTYKAKKNKKIGQYCFTVKLKSKADKKKYGSTLRCYYAIVPKTPTGIKVKAGSKKLTVSWSKQKDAEGYIVEVSRYKNFKELAYVSPEISRKKTKQVVSNLEKGKTYYVRVFSIKKGQYTWYDENGKKYSGKSGVWSKPSKVKKIKVK